MAEASQTIEVLYEGTETKLEVVRCELPSVLPLLARSFVPQMSTPAGFTHSSLLIGYNRLCPKQ